MRQILTKAMRSPDDFVVSMEYVDSKGEATRRVVSPIRFLPGDRFLGLCLCREEPRQFHLDRCSRVRLTSAHEVLMPMAMT
jgi:predicted DNA-binding transcriptional regulator YafY